MMDKRDRPYGRVYEVDADRIAELRRRVHGGITQLSAIAANVQALHQELTRIRELLKDREDGQEPTK